MVAAIACHFTMLRMGKSKADELVAKWKELHIESKRLEPLLNGAREAVRELIVASGENYIETRLGTIALSSRTTTDWEGLARANLKAEVIEKALPNFKKLSASFASAPREWTAISKSE